MLFFLQVGIGLNGFARPRVRLNCAHGDGLAKPGLGSTLIKMGR
jgi:hypothetical protein